MKLKFSKEAKKYLTDLFSRVSRIKPAEVYVVILVVSAVIFATKYFERESDYRLIKVEVTSDEWQNTANQYGYKTPFWLSHNLEVGQVQRSPSGRVVAEIVEMENYERGYDQVEIYLIIKLMADYDAKSQTYSFQGQSLAVGSAGEFTFGSVYVPVQIIDDNYPKAGYQTGKFILTVKMRDVEPWFVDQLQIGATMTNRSTGEVIARLLDFQLSKSNTTQASQLDDHQIIFSQIPNLKNLTATVEIAAEQIDSSWFFASSHRIKVGNKIYFHFDEAPMIVAIIENLHYVAQN